MRDIVLIHGGAHGPWCWEKVIPFLEQSTNVRTVVAIDLLVDAQRVVDKNSQDISNTDYIEGVVNRIAHLDLTDIILVGHSMAGAIVPAVVHRVSDKIRHVLYLTTTNPLIGQSIQDLMTHPLSPISRGLDFNDMFCNDLDEETSQWLLGNLREDPPQPFTDKVEVSTLPPGVSSTYIICEKDLALPVEYQLEQAANAGVGESVRIDSGHSAFASKPQELAELVLRYV